MLLALFFTVLSLIYLGYLVLVAAGLYKEPVLRQFERYAPGDDAYHLLPSILFAIGLVSLFGGFLFNAVVAPRYPLFAVSLVLFIAAYAAYTQPRFMAQYPQIFLVLPRWYAELRERTTREERRHIAYMWLCLPRSARLHLNGSDHHFQLWADYVILATVTQTVEDQESEAADRMPFSPLNDYIY